jgi:hypothetical protein
MSKSIRCGVVALVATGAVAVAAPAIAGSPAEHATADFMSGPFHVQFTASRAANAPADAATPHRDRGDDAAHPPGPGHVP